MKKMIIFSYSCCKLRITFTISGTQVHLSGIVQIVAIFQCRHRKWNDKISVELIRFQTVFFIVYNRDEYQSTLVLMKRIFCAIDLFRMACGVCVHKPFEVSWCMPEKCQYCAKIFYLKITWNAWAIDAKKIIWEWKKIIFEFESTGASKWKSRFVYSFPLYIRRIRRITNENNDKCFNNKIIILITWDD